MIAVGVLRAYDYVRERTQRVIAERVQIRADFIRIFSIYDLSISENAPFYHFLHQFTRFQYTIFSLIESPRRPTRCLAHSRAGRLRRNNQVE